MSGLRSQRPGLRFPRPGSPGIFLLATAIAVAWIAPTPLGQSGTTSVELITATPGGVPGGGQIDLSGPGGVPQDVGPQRISADNRYVVFASASDQLVPGDVNGRQDIFRRDRQTGTTTIVSRASSGLQANDHSSRPVISADGRFVAFVSIATNLDPRDTNGRIDVFVRDVASGTTTLVSLSSLGAVANFGAYDPAISGDGRYIAFASSSDTLVPGDTNVFNADVFVRDTLAGTTQRVSLRPDGTQIVRADSYSPSISADGRRVAFRVDDSTLGGPPPASDGPNLHKGIYIRDLDANTTTLVSARPDGAPADHLLLMEPVISANGRFVSFRSWEDLDPAHPDSHLEPDGAKADVFVRDLAAGVTHRVSFPFQNGPEEGDATNGTISGDGRYVAYLADLDDLGRVHVRDRLTGTTTVVTAPGGVPPDDHSGFPSISEDGQVVAFESRATNLVPGDTNSLPDVFLARMAPLADLSLTLQASTLQPAPGSDVTFTLEVANAGPSDTTGVAVRVALPPGLSHLSDDGGGSFDGASGTWSAGSLTTGSTRTLRIVTRLAASTPVAITAQVSASAIGDPDSTPDNDDPAEDDQRTMQLTPALADLSLALTASTTTPVVNSNVVLTTTVVNGGPVAASGVVVRLPLPAGLTFVSAMPAAAYGSGTGEWTVPAVAHGTTATLQVVARVTNATAVDVVSQVSAANEADPDSAPGNDDPAEDDQSSVRITPTASTGIIVNDASPAVNGNDGLCTLIEAIVAANTDSPSGNALGECAGGNGADTIHLRALTPPYTLDAVHNLGGGPNGLPVIRSDITIAGGGAAIERSPVPGTPEFRLFTVAAGARLVLSNVIVRNGVAATTANVQSRLGGGVFSLGMVELIGSFISHNRAACDGGGIYTQGPLMVRGGSVIHNNASGCSGGGIAGLFAGTITVVDAAIRVNSAAHGGGGFYIHGTVAATMHNTLVDGNTAVAEGGGVFTHNADANLAMTHSQVLGNTVSAGHGGGIANGRLFDVGTVFVPGGTMTIANSAISNNRALGALGGGIANAGVLTLTSSTIAGNRGNPLGSCGGGIYTAGPLSTLSTDVIGNTTWNGGGLCAIGTSIRITGGTISANSAANVGGGLALKDSPATVLTGVAVAGNSAVAKGGGLSSETGSASHSLVIAGSMVQQNTTTTGDGGGLFFEGGTVTLRENTRTMANTAAAAGGGIAVGQGSGGVTTTLTIDGGMIDGNTANGSWSTFGGGGGLVNAATTPGASVTLNGVAITDNRAPASGDGGGIFNRGTLSINGGVIAGNVAASSGGGLANGSGGLSGGIATLANVTIENNTSVEYGGGVSTWTAPAAVTLNNSSVRGNSATAPQSWGGGILSFGQLTLSGTTVSGNTAANAGGVYVADTAHIVNSTLSGNTATTAGGMYAAGLIQPDGTYSTRVDLIASTIVNNTGYPGGIANSAHLHAVANILAANRRPDGTVSECLSLGTPLWDHIANLVGLDLGCAMATDGGAYLIDSATVFANTLGPLADNGGPTRTHALLPGSFAIDAGATTSPGFLNSCPPTDQRGLPRPRDGGTGIVRCDLGSVEQQDSLVMPTPAIASLTPAHALVGGVTQVVVNGAGFTAHARARWNGAERSTLGLGPSLLRMVLLPEDLDTVEDISTGLVTVANPNGDVSNALPFTIVSTRIGLVSTQIAQPGSTATASVPVAAGQHGVSAVLSNNDPSSSPATLTVATYTGQPVGGTIVAAGGFFDVQVTGADPTDSLQALFYYPNSVTGMAEAALQLQYWSGAAWAPVIGSGGALPQKNTADNLDATVSGGRFAVTLDGISTPSITALSGTVFAIAVLTDTVPPVTTATRTPSPTGHWDRGVVVVTLSAADEGSGVALTEFKLNHQPWQKYAAPIRIEADGVHTLRYRSRDVAGNEEAARELTVRIDTTPPVLKLLADPFVLWPADGRLHKVVVKVSVNDARSGVEGVTLVSVASSDGDTGPPDIVGWQVGTPDTQGQLRAGASGRFRIYLLTYEAVDRAGNRARATAGVIGPGFR